MNQSSRASGHRSSRQISSNNQNNRNNHNPIWSVGMAHGPYGIEYLQYNHDEKEPVFDTFQKQNSVVSNTTANLFLSDPVSELSEIHTITPPLSYAVRNMQGSESAISSRNNPLHTYSSIVNPTSAEFNSRSTFNSDYSSLRLSDVRRSPIHIQNAAPFFHSSSQENYQKNEAPPCKKPKLAHHAPDNSSSRWESFRSPRLTHSSHRRNSSNKKLRYSPFNNAAHIWEHNDSYHRLNSPPHHHAVTCQPMHSSPPASPLQSSYVSQVPINVPVSIYTGQHFTVRQGSHSPSQVHNMYATPSAHYQVSPMPSYHLDPSYHLPSQHHLGHPSSFVGSPPLSPTRYFSEQVHVPPSYIPDSRNAQVDLNPRSCQPVVGNIIRTPARRWRYHPFQSNILVPNVFQFLAMLTPLSPPEIGSPESDMENYEALLHVAARLSEKRPRGLNRTEISQIPSFKFKTGSNKGEQTSCVVCMCDFENLQMIRHLPCSHKFHAKCVDKWLKTNSTCPICRGDAIAETSFAAKQQPAAGPSSSSSGSANRDGNR